MSARPRSWPSLVRLKADIIVTHATQNVVAAKQGTSVIPIVFAAVGRPGRHRPRRESTAPRRQRHRLVASDDRSCRQTTFTPSRGYSRPRPVGDHVGNPNAMLEMCEVQLKLITKSV